MRATSAWLGVVALLAAVAARGEDAPDPKQVREAVNKTDVGFFLLLDKNEPRPEKAKVQEALNKTDVGFFLLLDKNEPRPDKKQVQEAVNKTDVGFFLLLDKNEPRPEKAKVQEAVNKTDVGFFLLLDKNEPRKQAVTDAVAKTDVGFFLLLDKDGGAPPDEVELGRKLFFDPRLSSNKTMSCASCHNPSLAWRDGLPRARGLNGVELARRTPTLLNVHHVQQRFLWDGRAGSVEEAALNALTSRLEMNRDPWELVRELNRVPEYAAAFTYVYGLEGITPQNAAKAIASFVKAEIRPGTTPFDRVRDDASAMSASAQRGLVTFAGKGRCVLCHTGPGLSDGFFHNTGVVPTPGVEDLGRFAVTPNESARRSFRTMPLRNVALTAPYMHNGSIKTLAEVVEFYDRGGDLAEDRDPVMQPLHLDAREKADLVAFLEALTGEQAAVTAPVLPQEAAAPGAAAAALWNLQRARMLERDLKARELKPLAANAAAMKENAQAAARADGLESLLAGDCLAQTGALAGALDAAASAGAPWDKLQKDGAALAASARRCAQLFAGGPRERAARALGALDAWLDKTDAAVKGFAAAGEDDVYGGGKACRDGFTMAGYLKAVAKDKAAAGRARATIVDDLLLYHQYRAFAAKDPKVCDALEPVEKHYFGISRTGAWGCREWFWDMSAADSLTRRDGRFQGICEHSILHDYPNMSEKDGKEVCGIIAKDVDRPEAMCRNLIPKYLGPETLGACVNEFARYSRDADVGKTQEGVPDQLFRRYVALDRYVRARRGNDPAACDGSELCRVLMGEGEKLAEGYAARVRDASCAPAVKAAQDPARPRAMLERGAASLTELAARSAGRTSAAELDRRAERLARLRLAFDGALARVPGDGARQGSLGRAPTVAGD